MKMFYSYIYKSWLVEARVSELSRQTTFRFSLTDKGFMMTKDPLV
jgi:hypothetical protein